MTIFYYDLQVIFCVEPKKVLLLEEFLFDYCFDPLFQCEYVCVQSGTFMSMESSDMELKDNGNQLIKEGEKGQTEREEEEVQISKNDQNSNDVPLFHQSQEILNGEDFHQKKRHFLDEYLNIQSANGFRNFPQQLDCQLFLKEILQNRIINLQRFVVYASLKKEGKFQIDDAQNFGFDFALYSKSFVSNSDEKKDFSTGHTHSQFLLTIDPSFNLWLGYARIAHNVGKKMIVATLELIDSNDDIHLFENAIEKKLLQEHFPKLKGIFDQKQYEISPKVKNAENINNCTLSAECQGSIVLESSQVPLPDNSIMIQQIDQLKDNSKDMIINQILKVLSRIQVNYICFGLSKDY